MIETIFWIIIFLIFYTYIGYGILVCVAGKVFRQDIPPDDSNMHCEPTVCLLVASFNEAAWIEKKICNSLRLDYPEDKLRLCWVNDGSDDESVTLLKKYPQIMHLHKSKREGKMAAINLAMPNVDAEIVIISDANSMLTPRSVREVVACFRDPKVGCVAGEKKLYVSQKAAGVGEGFYWRYESWLKNCEGRVGVCMGASGELLAVRRELFPVVADDTITEDFAVSIGIALEGYKIGYASRALAQEAASAAVKEEFKRKTRIAAGHLQYLLRTPQLWNPFRHPMLFWQYVSHKFLRSFVAPFFLPALLPLNAVLLMSSNRFPMSVYIAMLCCQFLFYGVVFVGKWYEDRHLSMRFLHIPYYFVAMNLACVVGCYGYLTGRQTVLWEKAVRENED